MDTTTKPFRRAAVPADALDRPAGPRASVVDLAADLRTLTTPAASVLEQRDQALKALAATVAALHLGWPVPELFAVGTLTKYGLVPPPGADPHQLLAGTPWWASPRDAAAGDLHADDDADGGLRRAAQLPVSEHAPEYARRLVAALQADWHLPEPVAEDARLVASELVTNAVRHAVFPRARCAVRIEARWSADRGELTIAVGDPDPTRPRISPPPDLEALLDTRAQAGQGGAGLRIVRALAERFGVDVHPGQAGKTVYASLSTRGDAA
jgi:anti-sigma regulatory factor (Ser/Thr protein kinase)